MEAKIADYREILQKELLERCERHPKYSLRTFAKELDLAPSRLCEILNGKQGLSRSVAEKLTEKLKFGTYKAQYFCELVVAQHARSAKDRSEARERLRAWDFDIERDSCYNLEVDTFAVIADWYHLAILQLLRCQHFQHDPKWIARRLSVPLGQIEMALERLVRVGLLEEKDGIYSLVKDEVWVSSKQASASIRHFQKQVLEKAQAAMEAQAVDARFYTTHVFSIHRSQIPKLSESLQKLHRQFRDEYSGDGSDDILYCLSSQLFQLENQEQA